MSGMAELASRLSTVPRMRFSRSTFLRNTEPRSRGAPFFCQAGNSQTYSITALARTSPTRSRARGSAQLSECNAAHKALPVSALKSAAAHNDVNLASGGGHETQSNEVRARLLDGPCGGGDHPGDQTVGGRARLAEQVGIAHSGAGDHLSAATLESVLKTGGSSAETNAVLDIGTG